MAGTISAAISLILSNAHFKFPDFRHLRLLSNLLTYPIILSFVSLPNLLKVFLVSLPNLLKVFLVSLPNLLKVFLISLPNLPTLLKGFFFAPLFQCSRISCLYISCLERYKCCSCFLYIYA